MGIFKSHKNSDEDMLGGAYADDTSAHTFHAAEDETKNQSSSSKQNSSSATHDSTSSHKSACGCGCGSRTKPMDEEVVEIKEEWDY
ncbi:MAG: hypothetical protein IJ870_01260 [Alphaproteobacteria bacterium]|nr:hypothetical protein [Alphaproteobacteria bacterium]